ncbi:uncharacterized [Tachysurus ichikawai]
MVKVTKQQEIKRKCSIAVRMSLLQHQRIKKKNMTMEYGFAHNTSQPESTSPLHSAFGKTCKDLIYRRLEQEMVHSGDGKTGTWIIV